MPFKIVEADIPGIVVIDYTSSSPYYDTIPSYGFISIKREDIPDLIKTLKEVKF
jgi:hypothetical protein